MYETFFRAPKAPASTPALFRGLEPSSGKRRRERETDRETEGAEIKRGQEIDRQRGR
jgi:hypothetical protein